CGLSCANADIRLACLELLIRRECLDDDKINDLLEHEDIKVRLKVLIFLSEKNRCFYAATAEKLLKPSKDAMIRDEYYNEYLSLSLQFDTIDSLNRKLSSDFSFDAKILVAIAKKDKRKYLPKIRGYLNDYCESYYSENLKIILTPGQLDVPFLTENIRVVIKNNMMSDCLTWLASCMLKEDMQLIRRIVERGDVLILGPVMEYFKKYGEWNDIFLLDKAKYSTNNSLLTMYSQNDVVYDRLADVFLKIAKGREAELIFSNINDLVRYRIIAKLSVRVFSELSDAQISSLLSDGYPLIREKSSLRVIESFSKSRIDSILSQVLSDVTYFYNVVHWLDLGISVKQSIYQASVRQLLKD
ncbi:TPA: hypothetical protein MXQ19_003259, partial [Citrobacter freundii]|nr:hypothetical protein [Citrobacter freundii]